MIPPQHPQNWKIRFCAYVTIASPSPLLCRLSWLLSWPSWFESRPISIRSGKSFLLSRAFCSDHARKWTRSNSFAFVRSPWLNKRASLTRFATSLRKLRSSKALSGGARLSGGNIKRAMVRSRSSRNLGFVGARGARCVVAKLSAGVTSAFGVDVQVRMSSTSCRRSKEKWSAESWSRTFKNLVSQSVFFEIFFDTG